MPGTSPKLARSASTPISSSGRLASNHWRSSSRNLAADGPSSISMPIPSGLLVRLEQREPPTVGELLPGHPDRHAHLHLVRRAVHNIGHDPGPFLQVDQRYHVPVAQDRVGPVLDGEGVDAPLAGRRPPLEAVAQAAGADLAGVEHRHLAVPAPLQDQLAPPGGVPERLGGRGDRRLHPGGPALLGAAFGGGHDRVASVPRTRVDMQDRTMPEPWATATSAPGTWRGPPSPRSWRTASTIRNIPYIPGWV